MNFLELRRVYWDAATDDDLFDYKFWHRTDEANPKSVAGSTWRDDLSAISAFNASTERLQGAPTPVGTSASFVRGGTIAIRAWGLVWTLQVAAAGRGRLGSGLLM
ncbi:MULTISPECIES: hypothetical protein [Arthrobacter]|uniref:hypothetical protein n=1 Tax=Arthrobacter TaxID=1663 RepID=UPI00105769AC|nr:MULTISPECIES: hypothetical protein [Arthrobacter]